MAELDIDLPPKLVPVFFYPARYRGAYGGRGSGKTVSFATMAAVRGMMFAQEGRRGLILCGREFQNSLDESSLAEVKEAIENNELLANFYDVGEKYVRTKCGKVHFSFSGLHGKTINSITSKSKILIFWADEAEQISEKCWRKITPTVRADGSEIWVTWNPETDGSATDERWRKNAPPDARIVSLNWRENPWWTDALEQERLNDKMTRPHTYQHVWEGDYLEVSDNAYYTEHILQAKESGRWGIDIPEDPLMQVRLFADIGGTGSKADNFVFWAAQFSGDWINFVNHYEQQGQPIGAHLDWLRSQGYTPDRAQIWLPHDGSTHDRVYDASYESELRRAGYNVEVVPNQGKGAAKQRVELMRNHFSRMRFGNKCDAGMKALAWYHEKVCDKRRTGLGPDHDWSSHSSDAAAMAPLTYKPPKPARKPIPQARINIA